MKIERINDNQIKFTLTRSDLASRQIRLSELTYGTEKAKVLFQDMVEQASTELGCDISEAPLMIEAIPVSMDCIILMITMVDDPDEVDSRFSELANFTDLFKKDDSDEFDFSSIFGNAVKNAVQAASPAGECMFSFDSLDSVIDLAKSAHRFHTGKSTLYRSREDGKYYLRIVSDPKRSEEFSRITAISSEFGSFEPTGYSRMAYINEHFDVILSENAIDNLSDI